MKRASSCHVSRALCSKAILFRHAAFLRDRSPLLAVFLFLRFPEKSDIWKEWLEACPRTGGLYLRIPYSKTPAAKPAVFFEHLNTAHTLHCARSRQTAAGKPDKPDKPVIVSAGKAVRSSLGMARDVHRR